jgi:hypothetical protein
MPIRRKARLMQPSLVGLNKRGTMDTNSTTRTIGWVALVLVIVGALNWLLIGVFQFDLVAALFGALTPLTRAVYILVGIAGLYLAFFSRWFVRTSEPRLTHPRHVPG